MGLTLSRSTKALAYVTMNSAVCIGKLEISVGKVSGERDSVCLSG